MLDDKNRKEYLRTLYDAQAFLRAQGRSIGRFSLPPSWRLLLRASHYRGLKHRLRLLLMVQTPMAFAPCLRANHTMTGTPSLESSHTATFTSATIHECETRCSCELLPISTEWLDNNILSPLWRKSSEAPRAMRAADIIRRQAYTNLPSEYDVLNELEASYRIALGARIQRRSGQ
jgi:hypothetical protein